MRNLNLIALTLSFITAATPALAKTCTLSQSVYRDANGKGFELVFGKPVSGSSFFHASAVIKRAQQSELYRFGVGQSNGYGSIFLSDLKQKQGGQDKSFIINFFNSDFTSASRSIGREAPAPKYAFINELGSYDYYSRRASLSERNPPLGDTMWVFNRCQK